MNKEELNKIKKQEKEYWLNSTDEFKTNMLERYENHLNYIISSQESFTEWMVGNFQQVNYCENDKEQIVQLFDNFYFDYVVKYKTKEVFNVSKEQFENLRPITLHVYAKNLYNLFNKDELRQRRWKEILVKGRKYGVYLHLMGRVTNN